MPRHAAADPHPARQAAAPAAEEPLRAPRYQPRDPMAGRAPERPAGERPAPERPTTDRLAAAERPATDRPATDRPATDREVEAFRGALVSPSAESAVRASVDRLKRSAMNDLDARVEAILRPMLREWLDENLPRLVERAVRDEIERIARKG